MRVEPLTPALATAWDAYVNRHPDGWWWHTSAWIEYQTHYRAGNEDCSFAVVNWPMSTELVAVVPLMLSHGTDGAPEFSYSGDPLAPGLANAPEAAQVGSAHTLALAAARGVRRARVASSPFGSPIILVLPERPLIATPLNASHRVIALKSDEDLWHGVRKSYRSLIHRAEERYTFTAYTGNAAHAAIGFANYAVLHRRLATLPRADETYHLQCDWLLRGQALVMLAETASDGVVGAAYWLTYKNAGYYASGTYAVDDLAHAVIWRSLLALRDLGVTQASLGWQGWGCTDRAKWRALEFFRRGFGGADVPAQVAELLFAPVEAR